MKEILKNSRFILVAETVITHSRRQKNQKRYLYYPPPPKKR